MLSLCITLVLCNLFYYYFFWGLKTFPLVYINVSADKCTKSWLQHIMPPYGTPPHPYVAMYPHGGIYAHPTLPSVCF